MKYLLQKRNVLILGGLLILTIGISAAVSYLVSRQTGPVAGGPVLPEQRQPFSQRHRDMLFQQDIGFTPAQMKELRDISREYRRRGRNIQMQMHEARAAMVHELGKENPDTASLRRIAREIGNLHEGLKNETIDHYLQLKEICTREQEEKLQHVFERLIGREGHMGPGAHPRRHRMRDTNR
jgi:Spy/CpxP family protein refolding chaperone